MAAPKYKRHVPKDGSRHRLTTYIAVSLFVLVDVALIGWALNSTRGAPAAPQAVEIPGATTPQVEPTETSTPEPTASTNSTVTTAFPPTRISTALNDMVAWRAETGPCPETPASPEYTLDGGLTWTATDATGPTDITALQSITVEDDGIASMIGLSGEDCSPEFVKTFVAGDNYRAYPDQLEDNWYIDPADRTLIQTPDGEVDSPCNEVVALAVADSSSVAALCADQTVFTTNNVAATWSSAVTISGAVNVSVIETGFQFVILGKAECAGVQLATLSGDGVLSFTGCLVVDNRLSELSNNIGIYGVDGASWVWVGDIVKKTLDGGATWD